MVTKVIQEDSGIIGYEKEHERLVLPYFPEHGTAPAILIVDMKYYHKLRIEPPSPPWNPSCVNARAPNPSRLLSHADVVRA
jgi:hypothetical protein